MIMRFALFLFMMGFLAGCGSEKEALKSPFENLNRSLSPVPLGPLGNTSTIIQPKPYSPGSYFMVMKEVGDSNDTRVVELQYLSDKRFIVTETSFMKGDLSSAYFHKRTGTYTESGGYISLTTTYDSCASLTRESLIFSGDRNSVVSVNWRGNNLKFYSYLSWALPSDIASRITEAVEDVGCTVFKN